jgi:hypothetical protein
MAYEKAFVIRVSRISRRHACWAERGLDRRGDYRSRQ